MKLTSDQLRQIINETLVEKKIIDESKKKLTILESRKARVNALLSEKSSFLDKLGSKLGIVNPSLDVDDPKKATKALEKSFGLAQKLAQQFQENAINSTRMINAFHEAVTDALDKTMSLGNTLGADGAAQYQKKLVELVKNFYSLLKNEAERIETFQKQISNDLEEKGLDRRLPYHNKKGLKNQEKKTPEPAPKGVPASKTIRTSVEDPSAPSNQSFRTNVKGPNKPSNQSFRIAREDEE